jgi:chemotaxis regulatin CheY-phosphate phosphatase CheZ
MPRREGHPTKRRPTPVEFGERRRMSQSITAEIAMLVKALHELAAIRSTSEEEAGKILASADGLMSISEAGAHTSEARDEAVMSIMTVCGFHDLVGQRVTKIAEAVEKALAARLKRTDRVRKKANAQRQKRKARLMLHGPDLRTLSRAQARIDALLADA